MRLEEGKTGAIEEGEFVVAPFDKDDDDDDDHLNGPPALSVVANHLPRREEDSYTANRPPRFSLSSSSKKKEPQNTRYGKKTTPEQSFPGCTTTKTMIE